jgi:hypothetical protein
MLSRHSKGLPEGIADVGSGQRFEGQDMLTSARKDSAIEPWFPSPPASLYALTDCGVRSAN